MTKEEKEQFNQKRVELLEQLIRSTPDMNREAIEHYNAPFNFGFHELLDRADILAEQFKMLVHLHPASLLDEEIFIGASLVAGRLHTFLELIESRLDRIEGDSKVH
jgi:hypothetical protein